MSTIVGFFAHPDDESFGPAGTIAKLAKKNDVYIICATSGEEGENNLTYKSKRTIAEIRRDELKKSAKILGVKKVYFLGFKDGTLCNNLYHDLAEKVTTKLKILKPDTIMTFEQHGVSGHIDHITVAMVASYVFERLPFIKKIMYHAVLKSRAAERKDYFIYFPEGYDKSEIDETVDVEDVWETKVKAMKQHKTQLKDMQNILATAHQYPKKEYFLVKKK